MSKSFYEEENKKKLLKIKELRKTLPLYSNSFFIGIESRTTSQTRLNYARDLQNFYDFLSNNIFFKQPQEITLQDLNKLTSTEIELFLEYLSIYEKNNTTLLNSQKTKARKLSTIRSYFKYFFNKNELSANVASKVPLPKMREKSIIRLTPDEVDDVLSKTENLDIVTMSKRQKSYNKDIVIRDLAILTLLLGTGIRISECVGLDLNDIDFSNNAFKITRKGGYQSIQYFNDEIAVALLNYIKKRKIVFPVKENNNALFISIQGTRLTQRALQNIVKKYTQGTVPLKNISPHKLRSTYGTNLYNETRDIFVVAEVLGHKDVNTTKKYYAAISDKIKKEASEKVKLRNITNIQEND